MAVLILGVHMGMALYIMQTSKTKYAAAESYGASLLYSFLLTLVFFLGHSCITVAVPIAASYGMYIYYRYWEGRSLHF